MRSKSMETPKHLSHTPIVSWNDYHRKDGKFANKTDAMALSIGYAQYDKKERDQINLESDNRVRKQDISMKVWRKPGDRWSRQSEEILQIKKNCLSVKVIEEFVEGMTTLIAQAVFSLSLQRRSRLQAPNV